MRFWSEFLQEAQIITSLHYHLLLPLQSTFFWFCLFWYKYKATIKIKQDTCSIHLGEKENKHHLTDVSCVIWISHSYMDDTVIQEFSIKEVA